MKSIKRYRIGNISYNLDGSEEKIFYGGWHELFEHNGDLFIIHEGKIIVLEEVPEEPAPIESKEPVSITPGKWECSGNIKHGASCAIWSKNPYTTIIATMDEKREGALEDAKAIVSSVNNTYGKGLNPEAMEGLVNAAKTAMTMMLKKGVTIEDADIYNELDRAVKLSKL